MTARDIASRPDPESGEERDVEESVDQGQRPGEAGGGEGTTIEDHAESQEPSPLPLDAVFEILKNNRRRITLHYLKERDEPVDLGDLAEHVAIRENDISPQSLTSTERKRAYVGLYQCHLPKMDELGAVEFNRDRGIIELGPNIDQLEPYLADPEDPDPWAGYYLTLAAVNATLFVGWLVVGTTVGSGVFGLVAATIGGFAVLSFGGLAVLQYVRRAREDEATGAGAD